MSIEIYYSLESYLLRILEDFQPYLLFVLGIFFGLIWIGLSHGFRYLEPLTKRKSLPLQCYSTICRSGQKKGNKVSCYSSTCQNRKALVSGTNFKSA